MRTRKNARQLEQILSSSAYPQKAIIQTTPQFCELNMSPWDVISTSSFRPTQNQLEGNACVADYTGAVERLTLSRVVLNDRGDKLAKNGGNIALTLKHKNVREGSGSGVTAKEWQCNKKAKQSRLLSNNKNNNNHNHVAQLTHPTPTTKLLPPLSSTSTGTRRRGRCPWKKPSMTSSNPYDCYYYYSGFGPRWGKKRGAERNNKNNDNGQTVVVIKEEVAAPTTVPEINIINDDDGVDCGNPDDVRNKKRGRKPKKTRSLKSIMF